MDDSYSNIINYIKSQEENMSLRTSLHILRGISNNNMYVNKEWKSVKSIILRRIDNILFKLNDDVDPNELAVTISCLGALRDKSIIHHDLHLHLIYASYKSIHLMELHNFVITVFGLVSMGPEVINIQGLYDIILNNVRNRIKDCLMYKESVNTQANFISLLSLLAALPYKLNSDDGIQSLLIDGLKLYSNTFSAGDNKLLLQSLLSIYRRPGNDNTKLKIVIDDLIGYFVHNLQENLKLLTISNGDNSDPLVFLNDQLFTLITVGVRLNDTSSISLASRNTILLTLCQKLLEISAAINLNWDNRQIFTLCSSLRQLGFAYDMLPFTAQKILLMTISKYSTNNFGDSDAYKTFSFLYELTIMKFTWNHMYKMSPSFASNIVSSFGEIFITLNYFNNNSKISQFLCTVSSLSIDWNDLDIQNRRIIIQCFTEILRRNHHLTEEIMFSLIKMGATWSLLPTRPRNNMALVLGSIAAGDVNSRVKVTNVLNKMQAESRMIVKSLRFLL